MKYLYGASVQGIQDFIFETNKLKEIAGASEIVDYICSEFFQQFFNEHSNFNEANLLISAAGNIKYIFDDRNSCEKIVYHFPKRVMEFAPGITISQAVVEIDSEFSRSHFQELEKRLKTQRSRATTQHGLGLMISERSRRTGKPGIDWEQGVVIDAGQNAKRKFTGTANTSLLKKLLPNSTTSYHHLFPQEMKEVAGGKQNKSWIAVIHADGNDLGNKIMNMPQQGNSQQNFRELSERIGRATQSAAKKAFDEVVKKNTEEGKLFPFRPIILGGDDLTIVIKGELAIDFTETYLSAFEDHAKEEFADFGVDQFNRGLTACAGIAYIKENYPFHYGVHLAEELCKRAKKVARNIAKETNKELTPSCLLFHKVHSSFTEDYSTIISQELTTKDNIRFDFGPYFLENQVGYAKISDLKGWVKTLNEQKSPKSRLRNWLTTLQKNISASEQDFDRIKTITDRRYVQKLKLENPYTIRIEENPFAERKEWKHTHLFDAISLSSIEN